MRKHTGEQSPKQPLLMQYSEVLAKLDPRVRSTFIGAEQYVSALDLLQYHGNKKNPTQAWKTTLAFMELQGITLDYKSHIFNGQGQRPTPIISISDADILIGHLLRFATHQSARTFEKRDIHPAASLWLTKNGYSYIHEYEMPDYGIVDFYAKHHSGHEMLIEVKGEQNPIKAIFQVIAYGVQMPSASLAIGAPKHLVNQRCLLIAAKYNVMVILL